jgi:hypothetical protein
MAAFKFLSILLILPSFTLGQDIRKIKIEAKTANPKEAFNIMITKTTNEIRVVYHNVDSIGKMDFSDRDLATLNNIKIRTTRFLETLSTDSIRFYQNQIDSLINMKTFYKSDSASVYETTHYDYWKLIENVFKTPNMILEKRNGKGGTIGTIYLITLQYGSANTNRYFQIDSNDQKVYPLLGKLLNDTEGIIKAHQKVMGKKN